MYRERSKCRFEGIDRSGRTCGNDRGLCTCGIVLLVPFDSAYLGKEADKTFTRQRASDQDESIGLTILFH